jgi:ABC-2 type transport system ATP-binding protein
MEYVIEKKDRGFSPMNAVELRNVTKTFGKVVAVDDLSLDVPSGSVYGFIGPNGSGKTTTLRMIMNIFYPDQGTIRVLGREAGDSVNDRIGYLPEERGLYRKMKLRDLLKFYGEIKADRDVSDQVDAWLKRLELAGWADNKVEALSKGMSQKAQFIAAVVSQPDLLILDEPFSGLDPVNTDVLREAVLDLQSKGTTVIFSTHDMDVAEKMCDFIFMIFKGRKVLDGTLEAIQEEYGHDTLRISADGGAARLRDLAGVERIRDFGRIQELRMTPGADPQDILTQIMSRTRVRNFEVSKPSLHDIFIRIAGPEAEEVQVAENP